MNKFLESVHFRHACKLFDETKKIPKETFEEILEVGRLAPSSFGMEPTRLLVLRSDEAKAALRPLCWNQVQITSASEVVVFKTLQSDLVPPSEYAKQNTLRRKMDLSGYDVFCNRLGGHLQARGFVDDKIAHWSALQAYLKNKSRSSCVLAIVARSSSHVLESRLMSWWNTNKGEFIC
ncbi:nitroreductase family protein [Helicobacter typhlonius]|uniref:nitroreductase family protein n=1 Tax=Helicobacter typhlonius TaxID=76936 RepID=UPI002FE07854